MAAKVLAAIETFQEGGTIRAARQIHGVSATAFYWNINNVPDIETRYKQVKKNKADMNVDEAEEVLIDEPDPRRARVKIDTLFQKAKFYDRETFGDKVDVNIAGTVSLSGALEAAKARALPPTCDPDKLIEGEAVDITALSQPQSPDSVSVARPAPAPGGRAPVDPAGIFDD